MVADKIGRTKPSHAPEAADRRRKKNDGRPPDTAKELLDLKKTKKQGKQIQRLMDLLDSGTSNSECQIITHNSNLYYFDYRELGSGEKAFIVAQFVDTVDDLASMCGGNVAEKN